jgi:hypothetical protein
MWAAILKRVMVVLTVFALIGAMSAMTAPSALAGMPECTALMGETAMGGAPCDPATPQPGQPACLTSAIGCAAVVLPDPVVLATFVPQPVRLWVSASLSVLRGRTIEPNLFPPIHSV